MKVNRGDLQNVRRWMMNNGHEIDRLAKLGDRDAQNVRAAHIAFYGDKLNVEKQDNLIIRVKEFIARELHLTERAELQRRFGFRIDEI